MMIFICFISSTSTWIVLGIIISIIIVVIKGIILVLVGIIDIVIDLALLYIIE
jgi:hypothetical protein